MVDLFLRMGRGFEGDDGVFFPYNEKHNGNKCHVGLLRAPCLG